MTRLHTTIEQTVRRIGLEDVVEPERVSRFLIFAAVGASGIVVDGGITAGLITSGVWYALANMAGYFVAVTTNFSLNYWVTWQRPSGSPVWMYIQYLAADLGLFAVRLGVVLALVEIVGVDALVSSLVGIVVVALATFAVADSVVFNRGDEV